jgi:hypothetical protein
VLPTLAYTHDMSILYVAPWTLIAGFQIFCMLRMVRLKGLEGRRLVACLVYAIVLGVMWWAVLYGFQEEPKVRLTLDRELSRLGVTPGIEERQTHQYQTFVNTFGPDFAGGMHFIFIVGMPTLLPPLIAWGLHRFLKRDT